MSSGKPEIDDNQSPNGDEQQQPTETNINNTITNDHNNNNIDIIINTNPLVDNPDNTHNQSLEEDDDDDPYTDVSSISEEGGTEKLQRNFSNLSGKVYIQVFVYLNIDKAAFMLWSLCLICVLTLSITPLYLLLYNVYTSSQKRMNYY